MARPRRLPGSSEVRVGCPPLGRAERTFWVRLRPYGWISSFFTAVFCSTQLASSIAVPGVPLDPQEELMVTRDHRSVPFWDPISQAVDVGVHQAVSMRTRRGASQARSV